MSTQIQRRRGTTAEHTVFIGALAELTVDTTKKTLVVHDGTTAGGIPLARQDLSNVPSVGFTLITPGAARTVLQTNAGGNAAEWTNTLDLGGTLDVTGAVTFDSSLSVAGVINVGSGSTIIFEGSTANDFETTLSVVDPTADRTILLPNVSGTVITTGDNGTITSVMIANDTIVNEDINSAAAIAGTKISPNFGSQNIVTTGSSSAANFVPTAATMPVNGLYLPDTNVVGIATNSVQRVNLGTTEAVFNDAGNDYDFRVESDTSTHMFFVDAGNNRVGINNNAPGTALDVAGVVTAQSFIPSSATVPTNGFYLPAANSVAISTNGTGQLFINSNGNTGIGTLSAANIAGKLHVRADGDEPKSLLVLQNRNAGGSAGGAINFVNGAVDLSDNRYSYIRGIITGAGENGNHLVFATNANGQAASERLRITSAGNVGIGTSAPSQLLHVNGNTLVGGSPAAQWSAFTVAGDSAIQAAAPILNFVNAAGSARFGYINHTGSGGDLYLLNQEAGALRLGAGNAERARIDSSGRLLVGTSTSVSLLGYNSGSQFATADGTVSCIRNTANNGSPEFVTAKSRGSAGSPAVVSDGDGLWLGRFAGYDGTSYVEAARISADVDGTPGANDMPGRLVFSTTADGASSPTERMRITSAGNIGIGGVSSPTAKLTFDTATDSTPSDVSKIHLYQFSNSTYGFGVSAGQLNYRTGTSSDSHVWYAGTSERLRCDSSGHLLVGTSSARANYFNATVAPQLQVEGGSSGEPIISVVRNANDIFPAHLILSKTRGATNTIVVDGDTIGSVGFQGNDGSEFVPAASITAEVDGTPGANDMPGRLVFSTTADGASSPTERVRISQDGTVSIGKTSADLTTAGIYITSSGALASTRASGTPILVNRLTNDGTLVIFYQDSVQEGDISVSGTTVSYNGAHLSRWSQLPGGIQRTEILRGTVLSNVDEMCEWGEEDNEQLNRMKVSDVEGDPNVAGVFQGWDDNDDTYTNDLYCAMTGDFIIRIGAGVTVERGDLLMSAGDGTAKPQGDDIVRSKTVAKVTSTNVSCTYEDGSYCVPCVLMAC